MSSERLQELNRSYETHAEFIHCWLRARLRPTNGRGFDAEDLLQEVWVRAVKVLTDQVVANPRAWLLTIAGYVFLEAMRSAGRRARLRTVSADGTQFDLPEQVTTLTRRIARDEQRQRFFQELDKLADDDRQLLVHHGLEERPIVQVAERLGISVDAAHKRWQRLRDRLRAMGAPADLF